MSRYYFPFLCGNQLNDSYWHSEISNERTFPDLPRCFQNTFLIGIASLYVVMGSLVWFFILMSKLSVNNWKGGVFNNIKCAISLVKFSLYAVLFFMSVAAPFQLDTRLKYALQTINMCLMTLMMKYEYMKGVASSGMVSVGWLLVLFVASVEARSRYITDWHDRHDVIFFVIFLLIIIQFLLTFCSDLRALRHTIMCSDTRSKSASISSINAYQPVLKQHPEKHVCFFSQLFLHWTTKFIFKSYRHGTKMEDLWALRRSYRSFEVMGCAQPKWDSILEKSRKSVQHYINKSPKLKNATEQEKEKIFEKKMSERMSVMKLMKEVAGMLLWTSTLFKLLSDLSVFLLPYFLRKLIQFVQTPAQPTWVGVFYSILIFIISVTRTIFNINFWGTSYYMGQKLKTAFICFVFRKATRLSPSMRQSTPVGKILNLLSLDAQRMYEAPSYLIIFVSAPITIIISVVLLWQILGPSTLAGLFCLIILLPINFIVVLLIKSFQTKQMKHKDIRLNLLNEIFNGIKVLKMYSWTEYFGQEIEKIRDKEVGLSRRIKLLTTVTGITYNMTPYLVALCSFTVFVLSSEENVLDVETVFVSLSLFHILGLPFSLLSLSFSNLARTFVSIKRFQAFLLASEQENYVSHDEKLVRAIEVAKGSFSWRDQASETLKNINIGVEEKMLVGVTGMVGAGKSSLLCALTEQMYKVNGSVKIKGTIAYVAQQPWIRQTTLRDNIIFNKPFVKSRYNKVVEACDLTKDFNLFPGGDLTELVDKGINLSGGQKQRISLARALYQNADIYLLDDPFSAVDVNVGNTIFQKAISNEGFLKNKTRLLVTNNPEILRKTSYVHMMKEGTIYKSGSFDESMLDPSIPPYVPSFEVLPDVPDKTFIETLDESDFSFSLNSINSIPSKSTLQKIKIIEAEKLEEGTINCSVLLGYFKACGLAPMIIFTIAYISYNTAQVKASLWLSDWSNDNAKNVSDNMWRLKVYACFGVMQGVSVMGVTITLAVACTIASREIHHKLLKAILRAPMSFFDANPLGRILNRFSNDIDSVDRTLPFNLKMLLFAFSGVIATFTLISFSNPIFIGVALVVCILYIFMQKVYITSSRQLKRIDSNLKSPIFHHFSETLSGISYIRACGEINRFIHKNDFLLDQNHMSNFAIISINKWLGLWLESLGAIVVLSTGLFTTYYRNSMNPGLAGLSLSYALQVTSCMNMFIRMASEFEMQVVAVERVQEYTKCPQEAPAYISSTRPPSDWPNHGSVEIKHLFARYRQNADLVLNDITCSIRASEKVGVVGRTGAGKSSIVLSLFRILEPETGSIFIDGVNISTLGLQDLRSNLTVIPQDPILFSGSLRMNLDPSNSHSDDEVWIALHHSNLKEHVQQLPNQLETVCIDGGENFSLGQRQLICLARALLKKSKVLIFDEATAAVDLKTDDVVQKSIRNEFPLCTIITIAHRLSTIVDYDKILVLDEGKIVEFDSPASLLKNNESWFYSMAQKAGLV